MASQTVIPLTTSPRQSFSIELGTHGVVRFNVSWQGDYWYMNISRSGLPIAQGVRLVGGCDLLANHRAGIGRFVMSGSSDATLDSLGITNQLFWIDE